jgi:nitrite reductase (NADH) large subunit
MTAQAANSPSSAATASPVPSVSKRGRKEPRPDKESVVVVGNGMAGYKLCERLVALDATVRLSVTVFGEEPRPAYDRVHLTEFLAGKPADKLLLASREWYAERGVALHTGDPVASINREMKLVRSAGGREVRYDRLVFATGSRAYVPPFPGNDLPGVFVYRTLQDLERMLARAAVSKRVAVLGGGLLGVEAAKALKDLGLETFLVERGTNILARQLDPEGGQLLRAHIEKMGIRVCTSRETERIDPIDSDLLVQLNTGECLRVQMVVLAVGVRPRDELAAAAGLMIGPRGGIVVNDALQSSDPSIYAIGECASHRGITYGLAAPGNKMADTLATSLSGKRSKFVGADQSTWLKLAGIHVATLGDFQDDEETLTFREPATYRRVVLKKGRIIGALSVGDWPEQSRMLEAVEQRRRLWRWERSRFATQGRIWPSRAEVPVSEWPAGAIICNCVGIRRGRLSEACVSGCRTIEQLSAATNAGTVCGSCKPLLAQMVGDPTVSAKQPGSRLLLVTSVVALVLAALTAALRPLPLLDSVQSSQWLRVLLHDSTAKQITGFTLVGLALISLGLSLRKRIKKFARLGDVGWWKAFHAGLGMMTLVVLVSHTGFRLGQNLNFVLMTNFLAIALVGALAGGVTALEQRLAGPSARHLRAIWTGVHIALTWPLPVLVAFHILAAYYF